MCDGWEVDLITNRKIIIPDGWLQSWDEGWLQSWVVVEQPGHPFYNKVVPHFTKCVFVRWLKVDVLLFSNAFIHGGSSNIEIHNQKINVIYTDALLQILVVRAYVQK